MATGMPARFVGTREWRDLPPALHPECERARAMSDSAVRCLRWHGSLRSSAANEGARCAVCPGGFETHVHPVRAGGELVGFAEFGPTAAKARAKTAPAIELAVALQTELTRLAAAGMRRAKRTMPPGIRRAIEHIHENLGRVLPLTEVARVAALSPDRFGRVFRAASGTTYRGFLSRARIHRACELLISRPELRVTEVAFACGFESIPHFNRTFLAVTGRSPQDFARRWEAGGAAGGEVLFPPEMA